MLFCVIPGAFDPSKSDRSPDDFHVFLRLRLGRR
jgi:hypothetical protein